MLEHYLAAKDALTEDDFETARSHLALLKEEVFENDEMNNHEEYAGMHDDETLYLHYCPMANNREWASWISKQEKIANPYMGQQMLSCGKTEKEINPDK